MDLSGIEILSSDTKEEMNKVVSSTAIDYKQFNDTVGHEKVCTSESNINRLDWIGLD